MTPARSERRKRAWAIAGVGGIGVAAIVAAVAIAGANAGTAPAAALPSAGPADVAGYAFQDRDGDGEHDAGEEVLRDWPVQFFASGPLPLEELSTGSDGTFVFRDVQSVPEGASLRLRTPPVMEGPANDGMPAETALGVDHPVKFGESLAIAVPSFRLCAEQEACRGLQIPDLYPTLTSEGGPDFPPPTQTFVDTETVPGKTLLRFATSIANSGGLFHVIGAQGAEGAGTQAVSQRVYGDGDVLVLRAGQFTYHPEHHHVHVDDFVRYELLAAEGDEVLRASGKMSFCLSDIQSLPEIDKSDAQVTLDIPPLECGAVEQGIDTGYADYYGPRLPDQWLDVTGLPSAAYRVRITVDPSGLFLDADRDNNVAEFPVDYVAP